MQISMPFSSVFSLPDPRAVGELGTQLVERLDGPQPALDTKLISIVVAAPTKPNLGMLTANVCSAVENIFGIRPTTIAAIFHESNLHTLSVSIGGLINQIGA